MGDTTGSELKAQESLSRSQSILLGPLEVVGLVPSLAGAQKTTDSTGTAGLGGPAGRGERHKSQIQLKWIRMGVVQSGVEMSEPWSYQGLRTGSGRSHRDLTP